jgi:hypothetical protein
MQKYVYTILSETFIHKSAFDNKVVNEVVARTNYLYYLTRESAVKALNEQLESVKRGIQAQELEIEWMHHENIDSPSEFYYIKLKECNRPIGIYLTRLELAN